MMVFLDIFEKNLKTTYKTKILSKGTFLVLLLGVFTTVLPFVIAYKSRGFWLKRDVFYEQPDVKFKGEYLFTATISDNNAKPIICSTLPYYGIKMAKFDSCPTIKVRGVDDDYDDKIDELQVVLNVNLPKNAHITSFSIMIPLDYKIHTVCPLHMEAALVYQQFLPISLTNFYLVADLVVTQSSPLLMCQRGTINSFYNSSIFKDFHEIDNVITEYSHRNISTKLTNVYTTFTSGSCPTFDLKLKIRIPEYLHYYKPGFWQILKWAWVQYLAIYVIVSWIVHKTKVYIFERRLVLYYENNPIKRMK